MALQFGTGVGGNNDDLVACTERAAVAEAAGFDFVGYGDTQVIYRDFVAVLTACAMKTNRVALGPTVTNPLTRNPVVLANAMATIDEVSEGRAFAAIGLGASATANANMARAKPSQLAAAIHTFRSAFRDAPGPDGATEPDMSIIPIKWAKRKVPVVVHASGPLGRRVAAEQGDAVLMRLGDADWDEMPGLIAEVRQMHADGPRAGLPFDIWMLAPSTVGEINPTSHLAGIVSARAMTLPVERCPAQFVEAHRQYLDQYDYKYHASTKEPRNVDLMARLGLKDYLTDRFSLSGSEDHLLKQLRRLEGYGISRVLMTGVDNFEGTTKLFDRYRAADIGSQEKTPTAPN